MMCDETTIDSFITQDHVDTYEKLDRHERAVVAHNIWKKQQQYSVADILKGLRKASRQRRRKLREESSCSTTNTRNWPVQKFLSRQEQDVQMVQEAFCDHAAVVVIVHGPAGCGKSHVTQPVSSIRATFGHQKQEIVAILATLLQELAQSDNDKSVAVDCIRQEFTDMELDFLESVAPAWRPLLRDHHHHHHHQRRRQKVEKKATTPSTCSLSSSSSSQAAHPSTVDNSSALLDENLATKRPHQTLRAQGLLSLFTRFLRCCVEGRTKQDPPLTILIEDLQWASDDALDLWVSVVVEVVTTLPLLVRFLATTTTVINERSEQQQPENNALFWRLRPHRIACRHVSVSSLEEEDTVELLANMLDETRAQVAELGHLVHGVAHGNLRHTQILLSFLQYEELLYYDTDKWVYDAHVIGAVLVEKDVSGYTSRRLQKLSPETQNMLSTLACLGSGVDTDVLQVATSSITSGIVDGQLDICLEEAQRRGFVQCDDTNGRTVLFAESYMQEYAYRLIPQDATASFHARLGRRLLRGLNESQLETQLFVVLDQLLHQSTFEKENDLVTIATLCLQAGEKAVKSSLFVKGFSYLSKGISFLGTRGWRGGTYSLALRLHNVAAEVCYCRGQFQELEDLVEAILEHARTDEDSLQARITKIQALANRNDIQEALGVGLYTLSELGTTLQSHPSTLAIVLSLARVQRLLKSHTDESIARLPRMRDTRLLATMQLLNTLIIHALYGRPTLLPLILSSMVQLTLEGGLSAMSSVAFAYYGMLTCRGGRNLDEGYRYGTLALKLLREWGDETYHSWFPRVATAFYGCVATWILGYRDLVPPLEKAYRNGLLNGDSESAMVSDPCLAAFLFSHTEQLNGSLRCWLRGYSTNLPLLEQELRALVSQMDAFGQSTARALIESVWQFSLNMIGKGTEHYLVLTGEAMNEKTKLAMSKGTNDAEYLWVKNYRLVLWLFLGSANESPPDFQRVESLLDQGYGSFEESEIMCFVSLAYVARARQSAAWRNVRRARKLKNRLQKAAFRSPNSCMLGKYYFVEGAIEEVTGNSTSAIARYKTAILHLKAEGFTLLEALANEYLYRLLNRCSDGWTSILRTGTESHDYFLEEAVRLYRDMGAHVKLTQLEERCVKVM